MGKVEVAQSPWLGLYEGGKGGGGCLAGGQQQSLLAGPY
ncbi:hypothetical protein OOU_Y34scaffold00180g14 [Pyricularia oryzae Y34]|uniref:Uncharacterized protein n=2 Tax=Pyricularia oryzae TaxID=318829 RepID=A0AA97P7A5_PYRO3|nr:hypothetical protein OOU_Y34scaffold00180g14 [Pyricularia oryzae Y34]